MDGLRAVAISLVLLSHLTRGAPDGGHLRDILLRLAENGRWGVSVFFVISGFLITTLLMREQDRLGAISLQGFYLRRAFRILPAFYAFVLVVAVLTLIGVKSASLLSFLHAVTFTTDYQTSPPWVLGHLWSLSVEEQFYFVWPLLFVAFRRSTLVAISAGVICLSPFLRVVAYLLQRRQVHHAEAWGLPAPHFIDLKFTAHSRADMLMFGCLAALLFGSNRFQAALGRAFKQKSLLWSALLFFLVLSPLLEKACGKFRDWYLISVGFSLHGVAITFLLLYAIMRPSANAFTRSLNNRTVTNIGVRSYSLYLWQQLFIGYGSMSVVRSVVGLLAACVAAECSYRFVEIPMLKLKQRVHSGRRNETLNAPPLVPGLPRSLVADEAD